MAAFPRFRSTRCSAIHRRDLRQAVILARARGASWKEIGDVLHLTPEEVAKRYARSPWQAQIAVLASTLGLQRHT